MCLVRYDGSVQPCCMVMGEDRAVMGNVRDGGYRAVYEGEAFRAFRAALATDEAPDVCRGCAYYRGTF